MRFAKPLLDALDDLYAAFDPVRAPTVIPHCDHCIPDEEIAALLAAGPLRAIPEQLLRAYASNITVHTAGSREDARYFMPRILDIAIGRRSPWPELECIARFLATDAADWPRRERAAVDDLIRALWLHRLTTDPDEDDRPGAESVLCSAAHISGDLSPYLRLWTESLHQPIAARQLDELVLDSRSDESGRRMPGIWWDGLDSAVDVWLRSDALRAAIDSSPYDLDSGTWVGLWLLVARL